ncbi:hypothetical protein QVD17_22558 [Tagetes erecta]|uniref:Uncharacterized protein n=1 Tax=Tagetes erecta TaxID=13708 RepID=A0AAD8KGN6_TARER|nr:hypothetical protein QVD17_22558 [Tagetes erecta]
MGDHTASSDFMPWDDLSGKVVMVTGASSGIGREFCIDRSGKSWLQNCCGSTAGRSPSVFIANAPAVEASIKTAWDAFGRIDVLINNAGIRGNVLSSLELSEEEWNNTIRTNLTGTWLVSKYVCSYMRDASQGGSVINISSISGVGRSEYHGALAYSSSKAGVVTLTKAMAMEMGAFNINVNCICPGLFRSEITENLIKTDRLSKVVKKIIPLRTLSTVDPALTQLVRYLIHDSSKYINGNVFIVDGGTTLPGVPLYSSL